MYSANRTITKNTVFLYTRMMFVMLVLLYTSRVILQKLGIDDYGIYQSVGGIVALLSFVNGALSAGSSRFLTFELGNGDFEKLKRTFSTTLSLHILIAAMVVITGETLGMWFFAIQNGYTVGTVGCSYICVSYIYRDCGLFIDTDPL